MSVIQPIPKPHERYYLKDGVAFLVEDTLFKVPRYMLETSSPVLADLISEVPSYNDEATTILLPNVTSADFEHLLTFLYPLHPPTDSPSTPFSTPQWISILRLSTLFHMSELHTLAMRLLSTNIADPLVKIKLGREYEYTPWMREGFVRLCLREEMVSLEEAKELTKEEVVMCARAREEIRKRGVAIGGRKRRLVSGNEVVLSSRAGIEMLDKHEGILNDRTVLLIVNHAFGFPHIEGEDTEEEGDHVNTHSQHASTGSPLATWKWDHTWHWPSDLRLPSTSRLFWLISPSASKEEWNRSIKKFKTDLSDSASIVAVDEKGKHWFCGTLRKDVAIDLRQYITPVSVSVALGAVGALVLIPQLV